MCETIPVPVDVQQKVLICLDLTEDEDETPLGLGENIFSVEKVVRQAVCQFIRLKSMLDLNTEFAIVGMSNTKAKCFLNFVKSSNDVIESIKGFPPNMAAKPVEMNMDEFLFPILDDALRQHFPTISPNGVLSHICQVVIIYKSSLRIPNINNFDFAMFQTPGVIFDVLYIHDIPSEDNHVDTIFQCLDKFSSANSYILECMNTQVTTIFNTMSCLVAHPSQRTPQKHLNSDISYILNDQDKDNTLNGELF